MRKEVSGRIEFELIEMFLEEAEKEKDLRNGIYDSDAI